MKVVCIIDAEDRWYKRVRLFGIRLWTSWKNGPKRDDIVTVVGEVWERGEKYYSLLEWPEDDFDSTAFSPLQESTTEYEEVTFSEIKKEVPVASQN